LLDSLLQEKKWENTRIGRDQDQDQWRNTSPGQTETEDAGVIVEKDGEEMIAGTDIIEEKMITEGEGLEIDPEKRKSTDQGTRVTIVPGREENTRRARNLEDILVAVILLAQTLTPSAPMILPFLLLN